MAVKYNESIGNQQINGWKGLNLRDGATDSELIDCQNLSSRRYPFFTTRPGRQRLEQYKAPTSVFAWDKLCVVDDGVLYSDGEPISNVSENPQFAVVNSKLCIFPDKKYVDLTTGEYKSLEAKVVTEETPTFASNKISIGNVPGQASSFKSQTIQYTSAKQKDCFFYSYGSDASALSWSENGGWKTPAAEISEVFNFVGDGPGNMTDAAIGKVFIPKLENGAFSIPLFTADNPNHDGENNEGYVAIIRRRANLDWPYDAYYCDVFYKGDLGSLGELFKIGDRITISGSAFPPRNVENVKVTEIISASSVNAGASLVLEGVIFPAMTLYTVLENDHVPATYGFVWPIAEEDYRYQYATFKSTQVMRKGHTLYYDGKAFYHWNGKTTITMSIIESKKSFAKPSINEIPSTSYENSEITIERKVPDLDYICENNNRLWGVCNKTENKVWDETEQTWKTTYVRTIYASSLGDPTNFFVYDGVATDSYALTVASKGDFTDCVSYSDQVLCFKEDILHRIAGDYPANYAMYTDNIEGVQNGSYRASAIVNDVLYYKGREGVYAYSGGQPRLMSYPIGAKLYSGAVGGTDGIRYYVSMTDEDGVDYIFEYDTIHDAWYMQDHRKALGFAYADNSMYLVDGANAFRMQGGEQADVVWSATLTEFDEGSFNHKQYRWLRMEYELEEDAEINVDVVVDGGKTKRVYSSDKPGRKVANIPLEGMRCNRMRMVVSGHGGCTVRRVRRDYIVCSVEE